MWGDRQSNGDQATVAPTAVYWKLWRILKRSNLNGSAAVMSRSSHVPQLPCPPAPHLLLCAAVQPFLSRRGPGLTAHAAPEHGWTRRRCSSCASVSRVCCSSCGLLLWGNIMNWDIISKQPAGHHRSTRYTLGHSGASFTLFPTSARNDGWCNRTSLCFSGSKVNYKKEKEEEEMCFSVVYSAPNGGAWKFLCTPLNLLLKLEKHGS